MRGRPLSDEQVEDLRTRYRSIGGPGRLLEVSRRQVELLAEELGEQFAVTLGAKHSPPFISDAVSHLQERGATRVIGIALAPHESLLTTDQYDQAGRAAASEHQVAWEMVRSWHLQDPLIELWAERLAAVIKAEPASTVLFSAHSLPKREGDPYPAQVKQTAEAVAAAAGVTSWEIVFQSVPPQADRSAWLGPDLLEAVAGAAGRVVVVPIGFVSDHLEILFDVDQQAAAEATRAGVVLVRTPMPNDDRRLAAALAAAVRAAL